MQINFQVQLHRNFAIPVPDSGMERVQNIVCHIADDPLLHTASILSVVSVLRIL